MSVEWDPGKAVRNQAKHGVSFEEAATVFLDSLALTYEDERSFSEIREITVGHSYRGRVLLVVIPNAKGERFGSSQPGKRLLARGKFMKKEYDLSKMKLKRRGALAKGDVKVQKTIRLDLDVLAWLMKEGEERGIPYQTLLNSILKEQMRKGAIGSNEFRDEVRKIVRDELRKRAS